MHTPSHSHTTRFLTVAATSAAALAASAPVATADILWGANGGQPYEITGNNIYTERGFIGATGDVGAVVNLSSGLMDFGTSDSDDSTLWIGLGDDAPKGTLNISDYGTVRLYIASFGQYHSASEGTGVVRGPGAVLDAALGVEIGAVGKGTLEVANGGIVNTGVGIAIASYSGSVGTLRLREGGTIVAQTIFKGEGTATFDLNGGTIRAIGSIENFFLIPAGAIPPEAIAITPTNFGPLTLNPTDLTEGTAALTFEVTNAADVVGIPNELTGDGGFAKTGAGTLILTGINSFTGQLQVTSGTLFVNGEQIGVTGSIVEAGATLAGTGRIRGSAGRQITIDGTVSPGAAANTIGPLTFANANVTLSAGAQYVVELDAASTAADLLIVNGGKLILDSSVGLQVNVTGGTVAEDAEYVIARAQGTNSIEGLFENGAGVVTADNSQEFSIFSRQSGGNTELVLKRSDAPTGGGTVPEPSTYALLGGFGALLLALFRRRQRKVATKAAK